MMSCSLERGNPAGLPNYFQRLGPHQALSFRFLKLLDLQTCTYSCRLRIAMVWYRECH